jgi:hypothetical protein
LAIRSSALISESAAEGGVVPEAADMVPTLVILLCGQHYRKIVNISFSKNDDRIPPLAWAVGLDLAGIGDLREALLWYPTAGW